MVSFQVLSLYINLFVGKSGKICSREFQNCYRPVTSMFLSCFYLIVCLLACLVQLLVYSVPIPTLHIKCVGADNVSFSSKMSRSRAVPSRPTHEILDLEPDGWDFVGFWNHNKYIPYTEGFWTIMNKRADCGRSSELLLFSVLYFLTIKLYFHTFFHITCSSSPYEWKIFI